MLSLNLTTAQGRHHYTQSTDGKRRSRWSQTRSHMIVAEPGLSRGLETPVQCCATWCGIVHEQGPPRGVVPGGCGGDSEEGGWVAGAPRVLSLSRWEAL